MHRHLHRLNTVLISSCALGVALLGAACGPAPAPAVDQAAEAAKLTQLDEAWSAVAATRNADSIASFYAEDAIAYPPSDPVAEGKDAARKVWAAYMADSTFKISWKTVHAEVSSDGKLGYTSGTYEDSFDGTDGKTITEKGKYLCVWRKQADGSWKAVHDMWNTDTR